MREWFSSHKKDPVKDNDIRYKNLVQDLHGSKGIGGTNPVAGSAGNRGSLQGKCPDYMQYASEPHYKKNDDLESKLPYQRPMQHCRTFHSDLIESLINYLKPKFKDADIARLFENSFPNTLDTTVLFHVTGEQNNKVRRHKGTRFDYRNSLPETFVVTGDIHAEWLRDSARQLSVYQPLIKHDDNLREMILGAINTQAQFIMSDPYCNAFHPPFYSGVAKGRGSIDNVFPRPNWHRVFECKYEIDSLASFLTLSREYYENSSPETRFNFISRDWLYAINQLITVLINESLSTFSTAGAVNKRSYSFRKNTDIGSETLPLGGAGNPVNMGTGLIRSAFRPSDDATIFQFFIPGNAHMAAELEYLVPILQDYSKTNNDAYRGLDKLIDKLKNFAETIRSGIEEHAIVDRPTFGKVYAFETDGYGSHLFMDDANIPSLLSLPDIGFISKEDEVYQNTRKMILSKEGNPYYLKGPDFEGIGGPHIGIYNAWPMSLTMKIRTSNDDTEIMDALEMIVKNTAGLGLMHESINVFVAGGESYTRPWFAWANSEFAKAIFYIAAKNPALLFNEDEFTNGFNLDEILKYLSSSE